jgi:hypothetical protein
MNRYVVSLLGLMLTLLAHHLYAAEPVMLDKIQTYCFGRYLVDIPLAAELKEQGNTYQGATINIEKMGPKVYQERIDQKIKDLKAQTYAASYDQFKREIKADSHAKMLFLFLKEEKRAS